MPLAEQRRIAVLICHGMGQQVCYETLNATAEAIMAEHKAAGGAGRFVARAVERKRSYATPLARAELALEHSDGCECDVHLYEAYWAPVTEGKISFWEVVWFLFGAGWEGLRYCANQHNHFRRMLFPERDGRHYSECGFRIQPITGVLLSGVLTLLAGVLILLGALLTSIPGAIAYHAVAWIQAGSVFTITPTFHIVQELGRVLIAVCVWTVYAGWALLGALFVCFALVNSFRATRKILYWIIRHVNALTVAVLLGILVAILTRTAPGRQMLQVALTASAHAAVGTTDFLNDYAWIMMLTLPVAFWGWTRLRYFLVQFVGDVAIYVSAHAVDRFWKVREEINHMCLAVAREVYACDDPEYTDVIVVGHSLGSVIAYHTLNAILVEDTLHPQQNRACERTKAFITFGSPLDKVAFLFRSHAGKMRYRDGLDAVLEPLVFSERLRSRICWTNIYATSDIISGELNYFDDPSWPELDARRVDNERDSEAPTLDAAAAHTGYWTRPLFRKRLYEAVSGQVHARAARGSGAT